MERLFEQNIERDLIDSQSRFYRDIGLWNFYDFDKYKFRLSPDFLSLKSTELSEIREVSKLISCPKGFLDASISLFNKTKDPKFTGTRTGGSIKRVLTANLTSTDINLLEGKLTDFPFLTRLDLVKVRNPELNTPSFQIVEVEGDKTHAFGYVTFPKIIRNSVLGENNKSGILESFKVELESRNIKSEDPLLLIVGRSESFYLKELLGFSKLAKMAGINLNVAEEKDVVVGNNFIKVKGLDFETKNLVNIPKLTPKGIYGTGFDIDSLVKGFKSGEFKCLIPPFRFLGNKGLIGLVKNSLNDQALEQILLEVFDPDVLLNLRKFIPETIAVTKSNKRVVVDILAKDPMSWVIKEVSASGMKGVSLPDSSSEDEKRFRMLKQIDQNPFNFIIQKKIEQEVRNFRYVDPVLSGNLKELSSASMYMRISPFVDKNGLSEIGVTARESKAVHGSTDSIQIPVLF